MFKNEKYNNLFSIWLISLIILVGLIIVVGGLTRLTDSGLSITKWEIFKGILPPLNEEQWERYFLEYKSIPQYLYLNFDMSLDEFKFIFFWEYFHRLWGRLLGLAFGLPFLIFVIIGRVPKGFGWRLTLLLGLGGFQGVVGWWMVKSGLTEQTSVSQYRLASHLAVALVIFSLLIWTGFDLRDGSAKSPKGHGMASLALLGITILAGALVAGMDAGLLYNHYPLMGTGLVPIEYGEFGWLDPFENPASAQFHHRWIAAVTFGAVVVLALNARRQGLHLRGNLVLGAVVVQFILGIVTLLHGVPVALGGMHQAGAVLLLGCLLALLHGESHYRQNI